MAFLKRAKGRILVLKNDDSFNLDQRVFITLT